MNCYLETTDAADHQTSPVQESGDANETSVNSIGEVCGNKADNYSDGDGLCNVSEREQEEDALKLPAQGERMIPGDCLTPQDISTS